MFTPPEAWNFCPRNICLKKQKSQLLMYILFTSCLYHIPAVVVNHRWSIVYCLGFPQWTASPHPLEPEYDKPSTLNSVTTKTDTQIFHLHNILYPCTSHLSSHFPSRKLGRKTLKSKQRSTGIELEIPDARGKCTITTPILIPKNSFEMKYINAIWTSLKQTSTDLNKMSFTLLSNFNKGVTCHVLYTIMGFYDNKELRIKVASHMQHYLIFGYRPNLQISWFTYHFGCLLTMHEFKKLVHHCLQKFPVSSEKINIEPNIEDILSCNTG